MTYDPSLARAELEAWSIKCQHHLRQIRQHGDTETRAIFATALGQLKILADTAPKPRWHVYCDCGYDAGVVDNLTGRRDSKGVLLCRECGNGLRFEKVKI